MPRHGARSFSISSWLASLHKHGFLTTEDLPGEPKLEAVQFLRPGFRFVLTKGLIEPLRNEFSHRRERGGILCARPYVNPHDNQRELRIEDLVIVHNRSPTPEKQFTWRFNELWETMARATEGHYNDTQYLPVFFHTHPFHLNHPKTREMMLQHLKRSFSETDEAYSTQLFPARDTAVMGMPSALVIGTPRRTLIIGFYGGRIAPPNLTGVLERLISTGEKDESQSEMKEEEPEPVGFLSALNLLERVAAFTHDRDTVDSLLRGLEAAATPHEGDPEYITLIREITQYRVAIPSYEPAPVSTLIEQWRANIQRAKFNTTISRTH